MRRTIDLDPAARAAYDAIIDVRSPSEFALDHVPGAINLPVLDDAQRAEVGTEFVQGSKFLARRLGAAMVGRNIAAHLDGPLAGRTGAFRPLVYCWRGGQRSHAMATVMDQVGWPVTLLEGGYQTWRRRVVARLYDEAAPAPRLILLDGPTGSGKTAILHRLAGHDVQTLDLEGIAAHRGSLFGATGDSQPSQKLFETRLADALDQLDLSRPVVVEAESSRIGGVALPPLVWSAMKTAPRVEIAAPLEARVAHILDEYSGMAAEAVDAALSRLPRHHGRAVIARWREMARDADRAPLVRELIEQHYDPAYRRASAAPAAVVAVAGDLEAAAADVAAIVPRFSLD
ncbi:MAG TPA: tRNA 2-selenouridine(34) synthase MnmH [Caulobacteraceae bacterium]